MLERLDDVRWDELTHAYGSADDVPKLLRALAAADWKVRYEAAEKLLDAICHQGTVFDAAVPCVRFLAELLDDPRVQGKSKLLEILLAFAEGDGWFMNQGDVVLTRRNAFVTERVNEDVECDGDYVADLRRELHRYVGAYLPYLDDEDDETRCQAALLARRLPDAKSDSLPPLVRRFEVDAVDWVRATLLLSIADLCPTTGASLAANVGGGDPSRFTTTIGLAILARHNGLATTADVLDRLTTIVVDADDDAIERFNELRGFDDFFADVATPVAIASGPHADRIAGRMLAYANRESTSLSTPLARALLQATFRADGVQADVETLTPNQQEAIAIVARAAWHAGDATNYDMVDVLKDFGLPGTNDEIVRLLPFGVLPIAIAKPSIAASMEESVARESRRRSLFFIVVSALLFFIFVGFATNYFVSKVLDGWREELIREQRLEIARALQREREQIAEILAKSDDELTDADRNALISLGFAKEDYELTGEDWFRLDAYDLHEARKRWRANHKPLPKDLIGVE